LFPTSRKKWPKRQILAKLKGNIDKAIMDCGKALEVNRQVWMDAILYKYRAGLWLKIGKNRRYKEDLAKAQELSDYVGKRKP
jgi:hypothetical protein